MARAFVVSFGDAFRYVTQIFHKIVAQVIAEKTTAKEGRATARCCPAQVHIFTIRDLPLPFEKYKWIYDDNAVWDSKENPNL